MARKKRESKGTVAELKQRKVLAGVLEGKNMKQSMMDAGYTESYARASTTLTKTSTWQKILMDVDDTIIIDRVFEILNDQDKRASLQAADMLLKLKDKYPSNKTKTINYQVDMDGLVKQ